MLRAATADQATPRLVVKYRSSVDACAHCLLKRGVPFQTLTGTSSLDTLNHDLGVTRARAVFFKDHTTGPGRSGAWMASVDRARRQFSKRARRAPFGAEVPDLSRVYVLDLPAGTDPAVAAAAYASDPDVEWAEPEHIVHTTFVPNDPYLNLQWGLETIGAAAAWDVTHGEGTIVAINDTGVDYLHPDLAANMWSNPGEIPGNGIDDDGNGYVDDVHGWDFVDDDGDPMDEYFHGTHCAGIAAAAGNNGQGIAGVAWGAHIMATRGLNAAGNGSTADLAAGIVYAAENGADVVSNSWGGYTGFDNVARDAVLLADTLGVVVVAAAGNDADTTDGFGLTPYPTVITVGATMDGDQIASFSNHGDAMSVSAPGVNVLSSRASVIGTDGSPLANAGLIYLSGTSMATPHVAGLAALLLSADPTLTPFEVRTAMETNAEPITYPGFEGQRWNPYFGWGRIDAARVFDPPQTFTRLTFPPGPFDAFAGGVGDVAFNTTVGFTSLQPLAWTLDTPPWVQFATTSGNGSVAVPTSFDLTGISPGSLSGVVTAQAPDADDGGATSTLNVRVHSDERTAPESPVALGVGNLIDDPPKVVSNGFVTLAAWTTPQTTQRGVTTARIRNDGSATTPQSVYSTVRFPVGLQLASDGRDFLAVWQERFAEAGHILGWKIYAERLDSAGGPLDATAMIVAESSTVPAVPPTLTPPQVAWDGTAYVVVWGEQTLAPESTTMRVRRIRPEGSVSDPWIIRTTDRKPEFPRLIEPRIGCHSGQCLVAWREIVNEWDDFGQTLDELQGVRIGADRPFDAPIRLVQGVSDHPLIGANAGGYLIVVTRPLFNVGTWLAAMPVSRGTSTAAGPSKRIDRFPDPRTLLFPAGLSYDGTAYIATFTSIQTRGIFAARVQPDGSGIALDTPGRLVSGRRTANAGAVAAGWNDSVVVWRDGRFSGFYDAVFAQRIFSHAAPATPPTVAIGAIGAQSVAEGAALTVAVSAPGLDPAQTTFTATGLPPGAAFDPATRMLWFVPAADQAGVLPPIHFAATDSAQTVAEDVVVTVTEARLAFDGILRDDQGQPLPGVMVQLRGAKRTRRTLRTDVDGNFRFWDLPAGTHRVKLDKSERKRYRIVGPARRTLSATDALGVEMIVTRR
jgi:subtilase family protein/carboxypeptidase family protein